MSKSNDRDLSGWLNAIVAFGWWGFIFPSLVLTMTFTAERSTGGKFDWSNIGVQWSLEVLASRIFWCVLFCFLLLWINGRLGDFFAVFRSKSTLVWFAITSALIFINWLVFVIAAATDRLHQASLGYYMGPIFNVVLGYLFLGERLKSLQVVAVLFTCTGIGWLIFSQAEFPWISICLASSFGIYGLFRKKNSRGRHRGLNLRNALLHPNRVGNRDLFRFHSRRLDFCERGSFDKFFNVSGRSGDSGTVNLFCRCGKETAVNHSWIHSVSCTNWTDIIGEICKPRVDWIGKVGRIWIHLDCGFDLLGRVGNAKEFITCGFFGKNKAGSRHLNKQVFWESKIWNNHQRETIVREL